MELLRAEHINSLRIPKSTSRSEVAQRLLEEKGQDLQWHMSAVQTRMSCRRGTAVANI